MKKKSKNKMIVYVLVLAIMVLAFLFYKKYNATPLVPETPQKQAPSSEASVSIKTQNIKETNFSGKVPIISGSGTLATKAETYVKETVADFKKQADTDVPAMRKQFGADSPTAQYEIDIDAKYAKGEKTESVVMLVYAYTGGAHGNSLYKVLTASVTSGKIIPLANIIKKDQQNAFTALLKKELTDWRPEGTDAPVIFPEDVAALTFSSFANWSLDDKNLTIYFGQYDIGPGVLGPVAFPVPLQKIKNFLN